MVQVVQVELDVWGKTVAGSSVVNVMGKGIITKQFTENFLTLNYFALDYFIYIVIIPSQKVAGRDCVTARIVEDESEFHRLKQADISTHPG